MFILNEKRVNIYAPITVGDVQYANLRSPEVRALLGVIEIHEPDAPADYSENTYIRIEQDTAPYVVYEKRSDEVIAYQVMKQAKQVRLAEVAAITVTTKSGKVFDGDEDSQTRMARTIVTMVTADTINWVLADNSIASVTKAELTEALRLAGAAMAEIWVKPYTPTPTV